MSSRPTNLGVVLIIILAVIPVILWLIAAPLNTRFSSLPSVFASIGQILGLVGVVLFSVNLVLATRAPFLEKLFFGLNRAYVSHHFFGILAFILLLAHPLFLMMRYLPLSVILAVQFLLPSASDLAKTMGIAALSLMIVLLVLTLYLRPKYNIWKITHKFLGLAFFFASLHVYFIDSDVSRYAVLRYYILFFILLGLGAVLYKTIFGLGKNWYYQVKKIIPLSNGSVCEMGLEPLSLPMPYSPGQFIFVSFLDKNISAESHPFSLASDPKEKVLRIIVKRLGDYTSRLKDISVGAKAKITGPFGKFNYHNFSCSQVWVAGGIGITPFLGMIKELANKKDCDVCLIYSVMTKEEAIHIEEFEEAAKNKILSRFVLFCSSEQGLISGKIINDLCPVLGKDILLCGPAEMMRALRKQLREMGVPKNKIHSEEFNL